MAGKVRGRSNKVARWLRRGDQSAVAMELAILAVPFFVMFLGVMEMSYDLYVQAEMDNMAEFASRAVQVGSSTGSANETSSTFVANTVCPALSGLLDCALVTAAVVPVVNGNYYTSPISTAAYAGPGERRQWNLHWHSQAAHGSKAMV
jgi:Flp pilus assembly protein TadG